MREVLVAARQKRLSEAPKIWRSWLEHRLYSHRAISRKSPLVIKLRDDPQNMHCRCMKDSDLQQETASNLSGGPTALLQFYPAAARLAVLQYY